MALSFSLSSEFVDSYRGSPEPFGFGGLGALTFYRTYSRQRDDGSYESWVDVCERVINGMYSIQKDHAMKNGVRWSDKKADESAREAFDRMFYLKWTPSGRGLWMIGTPFIHERKISEAALNCAFITTEDIEYAGGEIFEWFMEMLMLGVGVGADVKGAGKIDVRNPSDDQVIVHVVDDSREGWAASVRELVDSYLVRGYGKVNFDYSEVRKKGEKIRGFGGVASGPAPLIQLHDRVRSYLDSNIGQGITSRTIADIFNAIGACVVAGNIRRSAEILLGEPGDSDFAGLKDYENNPERADIGWTSNNSLFAKVGMDYSEFTQKIMSNGEPGFVWMENARKYGRMGELQEDNGVGVNPCSEQILASKEMCLLTEIYMNRHEDLYDFLRTIKFAYLYAKTISLTYEWIRDKESRDIMTKNRRIGLSVTGVAQFIASDGIDSLVEWLDTGYEYAKHYDTRYSKWLKVNKSIRVTTVKPSGSVSLLSGSTPGVHHPQSEYYIRRVRLQDGSDILKVLQNAGFYTEPDSYSENTWVVEFPVHVGEGVVSEKDLSIWEQLEINALMQKHWSDNSVSVTIKVDPKKTTARELESALNLYQYRLKSVSMLPDVEEGAYAQMPYEEITKEKYQEMIEKIDMLPLTNLGEAMSPGSKMYDLYCDGQACVIDFTKDKK